MPELPEVETVARDLRGTLMGRTVIAVEAGHPQVIRFPPPDAFAVRLAGRRIDAVERHGKFIFSTLDDGDVLVFHLGMTGHVLVCAPTASVARHTHLRVGLDDGRELRYDDARRFGRVLLGDPITLREAGVLPRLGVEPLSPEYTEAHLDGYLRGTTRVLKAALLDQRGIAGLGNIYVDEACHLAGVRPTRRAHRLTKRERLALFTAIPAVLDRAIANRGTSFDDYRDVWNERGNNQESLQVYGRGGQPCFHCGGLLRRVIAGGRTTVYCPGCQR